MTSDFMRILILAAACYVLFAAPAPLRAQNQRPALPPSSTAYFDAATGTGADSLVTEALERNADLLATRQRMEEAQGLYLQAGLRPNPGFTGTYNNGPLLGSQQTGLTLSYTHTVELGGKRTRRVQVAQIGLDLARLEIANRERLLKAEVKSRFGEALAYIRNLDVTAQLLDLNRQSYTVAQARVKQGEAADLEERLLQVEVNRVNSDQLLLRNQVERSILELKRLAGRDLDGALTLSGRLDVPPVDLSLAQALDRALEQRPDLLLSRDMEQLGEAEINQAEAEGVPNLQAFIQYTRTRDVFDEFFGVSRTGQVIPAGDTDNMLGTGISINLPFRNRNQGAVEAAVARKAEASLRSRYAEQVVRQEVRSAYSRYETARAALTAFNAGVVSESLDNLQVVRTIYQFGELRILDVLNEQRRFIDTQRAYTDLLREYFLALVDLERAIGGSLF